MLSYSFLQTMFSKISLSRLTKLLIAALCYAYNIVSKIEYEVRVLRPLILGITTLINMTV